MLQVSRRVLYEDMELIEKEWVILNSLDPRMLFDKIAYSNLKIIFFLNKKRGGFESRRP